MHPKIVLSLLSLLLLFYLVCIIRISDLTAKKDFMAVNTYETLKKVCILVGIFILLFYGYSLYPVLEKEQLTKRVSSRTYVRGM